MRRGNFFKVAFNDPGRKESFIIPDPECRCVSAFAVDPSPPALARGRFVYWSSPDVMAIGRAKIDGTDVQISFISNITSSPRGMAVDANYLYWTKTDGRSIGRAKVDGTEVNEDFIADAGSHPWGIAVNATHIYWSTHSGGSVGQANLDGSNVDSHYISLGTVPYGIALGIGANANHIYVATDSNLVRADIPTSSSPTSANFTAALQSPNPNQMLVLAWSTNAIGFTLQSTVSLVPPVIWTPAATPPVTIGGNFVVTNSPSGILRYYRLRMPN